MNPIFALINNRHAVLCAIKWDLSLRSSVYLRRAIPVIVYQMGRVGSRSIWGSLRSCGVAPVFHVHRLNPNNIERVRQEYLDNGLTPMDESLGMRLYADIVRRQKKAKFITLVREPISRNISAFFRNFKRFTGVEYGDGDLSIEELVSTFVQEYRHPVPLTWFDMEMKQTLGIDVYEHPFPKHRGHLTIKKGVFELLILKLEIDDSIKEDVVAQFLDIDDFRLTRANVAQDKDYAQTYRDFLRAIRLPKSYVEIMCSAEYTRHFYSEAEIEAVRSKWRDRLSTMELPSAVQQELLTASSRAVG
jgi:hypothetical protein